MKMSPRASSLPKVLRRCLQQFSTDLSRALELAHRWQSAEREVRRLVLQEVGADFADLVAEDRSHEPRTIRKY
jgi:hypothetical protein